MASTESTPEQKRERKPNFSSAELSSLLEGVCQYRKLLNQQEGTKKERVAAFKSITEKVNQVTRVESKVERDWTEIRKKWLKEKKIAILKHNAELNESGQSSASAKNRPLKSYSRETACTSLVLDILSGKAIAGVTNFSLHRRKRQPRIEVRKPKRDLVRKKHTPSSNAQPTVNVNPAAVNINPATLNVNPAAVNGLAYTIMCNAQPSVQTVNTVNSAGGMRFVSIVPMKAPDNIPKKSEPFKMLPIPCRKKFKRKQNFTYLEMMTLLAEVNKHRDILLDKIKHTVMMQQKVHSWSKIAKKVQSVSAPGTIRTMNDVQLKWRALKTTAEKERKALNSIQQGLPTSGVSVSPYTTKVLAILDGTFQPEPVQQSQSGDVTSDDSDDDSLSNQEQQLHTDSQQPQKPDVCESSRTDPERDRLIQEINRFKALLTDTTADSNSQQQTLQQKWRGITDKISLILGEQDPKHTTNHPVEKKSSQHTPEASRSLGRQKETSGDEEADSGTSDWANHSVDCVTKSEPEPALPVRFLSDQGRPQVADRSGESIVKLEAADSDSLLEGETEHTGTPAVVQTQFDALVDTCSTLRILGVEAGAVVVEDSRLMVCGSEKLTRLLSQLHSVSALSGPENSSSAQKDHRDMGRNWTVMTLDSGHSTGQQVSAADNNMGNLSSDGTKHYATASSGEKGSLQSNQAAGGAVGGSSGMGTVPGVFLPSLFSQLGSTDTSGSQAQPKTKSKLKAKKLAQKPAQLESTAGLIPPQLCSSGLNNMQPGPIIVQTGNQTAIVQRVATIVNMTAYPGVNNYNPSLQLQNVGTGQMTAAPVTVAPVTGVPVTAPVTTALATGETSGDGDRDDSGSDDHAESGEEARGQKKEIKLECEECGKIMRSKHNLKKHRRTHLGERTFPCDLCKKTFRELHLLLKHKERHLGLHKIQCEICGKTISKENMTTHMRTHNGEKPYKCDYCGRNFSFLNGLKRHRKQHTGERPFMCDICGESFTTGTNMRRHRHKHTGEKPYPCDVCGEAFRYKEKLTIHQRIHTGIQPHTCNICGKFFNSTNHLTIHKRLHTGEKPYACEMCGDKFHRSDVLLLHKRKHYESSSK